MATQIYYNPYGIKPEMQKCECFYNDPYGIAAAKGKKNSIDKRVEDIENTLKDIEADIKVIKRKLTAAVGI